jgi:predicted molibdopterin-dependent oxidoreductase YjgC
MFKRTRPIADPVRIRFDGRDIEAERGDSVAAALLAAGVTRFRVSSLSGSARAPLCMIGNCFDCLVEIDGEANRQACRVRVREGMQVNTQDGLREAEIDDAT